MEICLVADRSDHPVLGEMLSLLRTRHRARLLVPDTDTQLSRTAAVEMRAPADIYLLKSRSELGLQLAHALEHEGRRVVNSAAATGWCRDRVAMAQRLDTADVPAPRTLAVGTLSEVISAVAFPAMVKSQLSRRGDLVRRVGSGAELQPLAALWPGEPVIVQELSQGDGWDYKAWVIGVEVHVACRRSPLETGAVGGQKRNHTISDPGIERAVRELARSVGRAFELELFGIDVLASDGHAAVVDVNAFPGFRGVPGGAGKLASYVERAAARTVTGMTLPATSPITSIDELPGLVAGIIERAGAPAPGRLALRYLRRKPARGLIAVYALPAGGPPLVCLRVAESAIVAAGVRLGSQTLTKADVTGTWPGVLRLPTVGLTLQAYPEDADLPALAEIHAMEPGAVAFLGVRDALREALGNPSFAPDSVSSEPLRYKPSDRCVLRLTAHPGRETVVGKVYADPAAAASVHGRMLELYTHQRGESQTAAAGRPLGPPLLPRPLALVEGLGLTLSEDVRGSAGGDTEPVTEAGKLLHPRAPMTRAAEAVAVIGVGLARLHTYPLPPGWPARTATSEATRAVRRAEQLAAYAPDHAERAVALAGRLAERLEASQTAEARAAHGSFKPAQLLFRGERLFITDFDQLCAADPALDVGYFLAYLRPPSLWYGRGDARRWYDALERTFLQTYTDALADLGCGPIDAERVAARSHLYSAALMFKIANRRPNRLNSVRPGELDAMLTEIGRCVDRGIAGPC